MFREVVCAASSTERCCAMSLMPPWTTRMSAPSTTSSRRKRGDLVGALAVGSARPKLEPRVVLLGPPLPLATLVRIGDPRAQRRDQDPTAAIRR